MNGLDFSIFSLVIFLFEKLITNLLGAKWDLVIGSVLSSEFACHSWRTWGLDLWASSLSHLLPPLGWFPPTFCLNMMDMLMSIASSHVPLNIGFIYAIAQEVFLLGCSIGISTIKYSKSKSCCKLPSPANHESAPPADFPFLAKVSPFYQFQVLNSSFSIFLAPHLHHPPANSVGSPFKIHQKFVLISIQMLSAQRGILHIK